MCQTGLGVGIFFLDEIDGIDKVWKFAILSSTQTMSFLPILLSLFRQPLGNENAFQEICKRYVTSNAR